MKKNTLLNALMLPIRLPRLIAEHVTPKVDIRASDKTLDRHIMWSTIGCIALGFTSALGFVIGSLLLVGGVIMGATASAPSALAILGGAYVTATTARICRKHSIDCLAVQCVNAAVKQMNTEAEADLVAAATPAPKTPDFNHAAAATLDKDIKALPAIKLAPRQVSP